jgi:hypothetical protein
MSKRQLKQSNQKLNKLLPLVFQTNLLGEVGSSVIIASEI